MPIHCSFLRADLQRRGMKSAVELDQAKDGRHVEVAGIILVRQKPGSPKGVLFITIDDETGTVNGVLWPGRFEAQRRSVLSAAMVGQGKVAARGDRHAHHYR